VDNLVISKKGGVTDTLKKIAAKNPPTGFVGGGFMPLASAVRVAQTLVNANKGAKAAALMQRSAIAEAGRAASRQWASTKAMKGSGKKFQASAAKSWHMRFIGENLKAASKAVPKKVDLTKSEGFKERYQSVAGKIYKRHVADVKKRDLGHADAVNLPRAKVLRNLAKTKGVDLQKAKPSIYKRGR
jgi:hypothetical protein